MSTRYRARAPHSPEKCSLRVRGHVGAVEAAVLTVSAHHVTMLLTVTLALLGCGDTSATPRDVSAANNPRAEGAESHDHTGAPLTDRGEAGHDPDVDDSADERDPSAAAREATAHEAPFAGPTAIVAGAQHTCALVGGRVRCWGGNEFHQLGDPTSANGRGRSRASREEVRGLSRVVVLGAGTHHTCAIVEGGALRCWGHGGYGQLGDGGRDDRPAPTTVPLTQPARSVAGGDGHTCAVVDDGGVWCWGRNDHGQLGDGTLTARAAPVRVPALDEAVAVAAGRLHTCALSASGRVSCWGANLHGQLGPRVRVRGAHRPTPEVIARLDDAVGLASGVDHSCALRRSGRIVCWGRNEHSQLRLDRLRRMPQGARLSLGDGHSCALVPGVRLSCVGANRRRQVGRGGAVVSTPRHVRDGDTSVDVAVGYRHTCFIRSEGGITCQGEAEGDLLGVEPEAPSTRTPVGRAQP